MLSNKAKYGLKALMYLANHADINVQISHIAESENIPRKFLESILLDLKKQGYVNSKTGKNGGYWLIKPPKEIIIANVIRFLDGPLAPVRCASLTAYVACTDCNDVEGCKIRWLMKDVRDAISNILDHKTLEDLTN